MMSKFLSNEAAHLDPYTPGEQPQDQQYIKLNTNESPFPPSPVVLEAVDQAQVSRLNLYSDPTCAHLVHVLAKRYGLKPENILTGNGSDEILAFAFRAFCGEGKGVAYADITYGFYKAQVALFGLNATVVPLREDFTLNVDDYMDFPGTIFIANPNAPTGIALPTSDIRRLLEANPDRVVVVDEAYVDFGAKSCVPLIAEHDNLLVVQTMSKSRSLAGGRVGYALGSVELIAGLNRVKYSFNPYNVNRLSIIAGAAAVEDEPYFQNCCASIREDRAWTAAELKKLGFTVLPSKANFLFAKSDRLSGEELYRKLKKEGILVRWWANSGRIEDYVRITVGSMAQMEALVDTLEKLVKEAE
jgi:histidinol-phosphate aminotransferase